MKGPTTSLHRFSRQTCTPPRTTPQRWANMITVQTLPPLPAEPITTAETHVPSLLYHHGDCSTRLLNPPFTHPLSAPNEENTGTVFPTFRVIFFPTLSPEDRTRSPKSCLTARGNGPVFQMALLNGRTRSCSYTDFDERMSWLIFAELQLLEGGQAESRWLQQRSLQECGLAHRGSLFLKSTKDEYGETTGLREINTDSIKRALVRSCRIVSFGCTCKGHWLLTAEGCIFTTLEKQMRVD